MRRRILRTIAAEILKAIAEVVVSSERVTIIREQPDSVTQLAPQIEIDALRRLLSRLIGQNVIKPVNSLNRLFLDGEEFNSNARSAISEMVYRCCEPETSGSVTQEDRAGMNLATALLDRYGTERKLDALASLFATPKDLETAVRRRVAKAFDIPLEKVPSSADDF